MKYFAARDKRFTLIYLFIVSVLYTMMIGASASFPYRHIVMAMLSLIVSISLIIQVYLFFKDDGVYEMENEEIWDRLYG